MIQKVIRAFLISAGCILLGTGCLKIFSSLTEVEVLALNDPLIGFLSNRQMLFAAGFLELAVVVFLFSNTTSTTKAGLVAWLSAMFIFYRIGLWTINFQEPCACLGRAVDWMNLNPSTADNYVKVLLAYLTCGSWLALIYQMVERRFGFSSSVALKPKCG